MYVNTCCLRLLLVSGAIMGLVEISTCALTNVTELFCSWRYEAVVLDCTRYDPEVDNILDKCNIFPISLPFRKKIFIGL